MPVLYERAIFFSIGVVGTCPKEVTLIYHYLFILLLCTIIV